MECLDSEAALSRAIVKRSKSILAYLDRKIPSIYKAQIVAEDILQEVCIHAFQGLSTFRSDGEDSLDRWLTRIVDNALLNRIRDAGRIKRGGGQRILRNGDQWKTSCINLFDQVRSPGKTPSRVAARTEAVGKVLVALSRLRPDLREAVRLRHLTDFSIEEVALHMNRSKASVHSLLYRGLNELKNLMGDQSDYLSDDGSSSDASSGSRI
jgi:RNA polymerase sigma factor (sigma-70 family)